MMTNRTAAQPRHPSGGFIAKDRLLLGLALVLTGDALAATTMTAATATRSAS